MDTLTDYIERTFDIIPSFFWVPVHRTREKAPVWNVVKVHGHFKEITCYAILNCQYVRRSLNRERRARRLSCSSSSLSSSSDDVSRSRSRSSSPRRRLAAPRRRSDREILKRLAAPRRRSEREISRTLLAPPPLPPLAPSSLPSVRTPDVATFVESSPLYSEPLSVRLARRVSPPQSAVPILERLPTTREPTPSLRYSARPSAQKKPIETRRVTEAFENIRRLRERKTKKRKPKTLMRRKRPLPPPPKKRYIISSSEDDEIIYPAVQRVAAVVPDSSSSVSCQKFYGYSN